MATPEEHRRNGLRALSITALSVLSVSLIVGSVTAGAADGPQGWSDLQIPGVA